MPRDHAQQISRVEVDAKRLTSGLAVARALEVMNDGGGHVTNRTTGFTHAKRQIEVLGVREQRFVEQGRLADRLEIHEHGTTCRKC
jgi:hypothetical protein